MEVVIRKVDINDASALVKYLSVIGGESDFLTFGEGEFDLSAEQEEEFIKSTLGKKNVLFIVAEVNGEIVGLLNFTGGGRPRVEHTGEFGITVLKEYWGQGIGEKMIRYLIEWSKETQLIRKINLRVRVDNERAIILYKRLGFVEEGIIKRDFLIEGKFYDSIAMGLLVK